MADPLDHIAWRRIPREEKRKKRKGWGQIALRASVKDHAGALDAGLERARKASEAQRSVTGLDASGPQVFKLTFTDRPDAQALQKLGATLLSERSEERVLSAVRYRVSVKLASEQLRAIFAKRAEKIAGLAKVEAVRSAGGDPDPTRLFLDFETRDQGKDFLKKSELHAELEPLDPKKVHPDKIAKTTDYVVTVAFSSSAAVEKVNKEIEAYKQRSRMPGALAPRERQDLFDLWESVEVPTPDERRGARLRLMKDLAQLSHYDVDLLHPGETAESRFRNEFEQVVSKSGGQITDQPTAVAQTLMLARVKGPPRMVAALLNDPYVLRVDLPPSIPRTTFQDLLAIGVNAPHGTVADDGPLACLVDSGVVAGHPFLKDLVADELNFSGDGSDVDRDGHGTHSAGVLVYGDVRRCMDTKRWVPRVRIISAKVMTVREQHDGKGNVIHSDLGFLPDRRPEIVVRDAITKIAQETKCRVFCMSIADPDFVLDGYNQLNWACLIDELVREQGIVLVLAAGNVADPNVPSASDSKKFMEIVREQVLSADHGLIDPASAALALTVGAISRSDVATASGGSRAPQVGSPRNCPAPFTRTGTLDNAGTGVRRTVKPELAGYGGNMCVPPTSSRWSSVDIALSEPSLKFDYATGRLLSGRCGTSVAAPAVAHVAARVEHHMRAVRPSPPTGNLVRALVTHSADVPREAEEWLAAAFDPAEAERRRLRAIGYGVPDPDRAMYSQEHRVVLVAEDSIPDDGLHLYEVELPDEFIKTKGQRRVRITLAYDPPVRGTRREYLMRNMSFRLYRKRTAEDILKAAKSGSSEMPSADSVECRPTPATLQWSTVQSAVFYAERPRALNYPVGPEKAHLWHVLVTSMRRIGDAPLPPQSYALVLSLEHDDERVRLHHSIRTRVQVPRIRVRP